EDGSLRIAMRDLPPIYRSQPERIVGMVSDADLAAARNGQSVATKAPATVREADQFQVAMAESDINVIARRAAHDTAALRLIAETHYKSSVGRVDKLLQAGEPTRALQEIAATERLFGNTPELALRRGVAELRLGRPEAAAQAVNEAPRGLAFAEEIAARL